MLFETLIETQLNKIVNHGRNKINIEIEKLILKIFYIINIFL